MLYFAEREEKSRKGEEKLQNALVKNQKIGYNKMIIYILIHFYEEVYGK